MKKKEMKNTTAIELDEWYTAGDAAIVLTRNSKREVRSDYLTKLADLGKIRSKKVNARLRLYYKPDVDAYVVEDRGTKSGQAKRRGKTGPTVREARKAAQEPAA